MAGMLNILQGGRIRANFPTDAGSTWSKGQAIIVSSRGQLEKLNGQSGVTVGLALENCVTTAAGNPRNDTSVVVQGQQGSILLGEALVETDNLSGTGGWTPGSSTVYAQVGGNFSYNSTSGLSVGRAMSNPVANGRLQFLFLGQ